MSTTMQRMKQLCGTHSLFPASVTITKQAQLLQAGVLTLGLV